jgi:hypothetical protein
MNIAGVSENSVRLEMAKEDQTDLLGNSVLIFDETPPSRLIAQGLELEEHQSVFSFGCSFRALMFNLDDDCVRM